MLTPQLRLTYDTEIIVDLFAGGGGMSIAIEQALGRAPDIAINHDDDALSMHRANHPQTRHFVADVFEVDPRGATQGRPVGLLHLSPDCTHHSQASGGQPRNRKIRALSWVGKRWAGQVSPRVITLENVRQILKWGPLIAKRDKATGRVIKVDKTIAEPGERVPVEQQYLVPDPRRAGRTWRKFIRDLEALGYRIEYRVLCAADYGAPTIRERLFMVARRDNRPIVWPERTHYKAPTRGQKGWRAAAACIDWSIPCPSIFDRKKPLADATMRRIAKGIQKYVLNCADPFIVPIAHYGDAERVQDINDPLKTITASPKGGAFALCTPTLVQTGYGERDGQSPRSLDMSAPLGTIVGSQKHAVASAYLMQANGGFNKTPGHDLREPASTITNTGSQQQLVTTHMLQLPTITPAPAEQAALRVAAFLTTYYGNGSECDLRQPASTITTRDRLALVTVKLQGHPYLIVDIGLRMLEPHELYAAQGFPADYIIDRGHDGRAFSKSAQVRMVGNSVSPPVAAALIQVNVADMAIRRRRAA